MRHGVAHVIDGVSYHPALDTLDCWIAADRRLVELHAYCDMERAELLDEPQPETAELSANELLLVKQTLVGLLCFRRHGMRG